MERYFRPTLWTMSICNTGKLLVAQQIFKIYESIDYLLVERFWRLWKNEKLQRAWTLEWFYSPQHLLLASISNSLEGFGHKSFHFKTNLYIILIESFPIKALTQFVSQLHNSTKTTLNKNKKKIPSYQTHSKLRRCAIIIASFISDI